MVKAVLQDNMAFELYLKGLHYSEKWNQCKIDMYTHTHTYIWKFITGVSSGNYWGHKAPQSAICKLENQAIWWCDSVWLWRSKKQEHLYPRRGEDGCPRSHREHIHSSSTFLFCSDLQETGWGPPALVRAICTQFTDSNASLFQKHPPRHIRTNVRHCTPLPSQVTAQV